MNKSVICGGINMRLEELEQGQLVTILVSFGKKYMEFNTMIEEVSQKKRLVYTSPIMRNDRLISFKSSSVRTHLLAYFRDRTPQIFRNVSIQLTGRDVGSVQYAVSASSESLDFNRRKHYRCYIGEEVTIMIGRHHTTYKAVLKDLSVGGFSFCLETSKKECKVGNMVHFVLNEFLDELKERFSFSIYGIIVSKREIDNNRMIYGCRITSNTHGIAAYIAKKERVRLQRTRGGAKNGANMRSFT